ncbi:MAG: hypothetical protein ACOC2W_00710 [bacterium]
MKTFKITNKAIEDVAKIDLEVTVKDLNAAKDILKGMHPLFIHGANVRQIDDVECPDFSMYSLETTPQQRQQFIDEFGKVPAMLQKFADDFGNLG